MALDPRESLRSRLGRDGDPDIKNKKSQRSEEIAEKYRLRAAERAAGKTVSPADEKPAENTMALSKKTVIANSAGTSEIKTFTDTADTSGKKGGANTSVPSERAAARKLSQRPAVRKSSESGSRKTPPRSTSVRTASRSTSASGRTPNRSLILGAAAVLILLLAVVTITRTITHSRSSSAARGNDTSEYAASASAENADTSDNEAGESGLPSDSGADADSEESDLVETGIAETTPADTSAAVGSTGEKFADTGIPAVALTYDDGPKQSTTPIILDVLEEYQAHATFFIVGQNVEGNEDLIKREEALGCELGNHSWNHPKLTTLSTSEWKEQLSKTTAAIEAAADHTKVTVMRPPYGSVSQDMRDEIDVPVILWRLDTLDWKTKSASATIDAVLDDVRGGDIILMHDIHDFSAEATKTIVPKLIEKGYKLLTVSELYDYYGEELTLHHNHGYAEAQTTAAAESESSAADEPASETTAAPEE